MQPTLPEVDCAATRQQVDLLLSRASAEQGNLSDMFWQNKPLRKALRLLAEVKLMGYTVHVPNRKRIGGDLRKQVYSEVERAVEEVEEDCDAVTGSSDGWNNDPAVKKEVELVLRKQFPGSKERAKIKAALNR